MKKVLKILIPIILALSVIVCAFWYLLSYDPEFTRDMLLGCARQSESSGNHSVATWFYNLAYAQAGNSDMVAIELADQYRSGGNYTKAEFTLSNAISDGGGIDLYIALSKLYVEQDKLLDAVNMLANITNPEIKTQIEAIRPQAPTATPDPGFFTQYISVTLTADKGTIYASTDGQYPSVTSEPYSEPLSLGDGENNIYAISISEDGLVSPLSIYGYTIGGVIEKMTFADSAVEKEVRTILGVSDDQELFTNDLWDIKTFTMPKDAASYEDLKHMLFLEELTIDGGKGDQLQNLSSLSHLMKLTVTGTAVSQEDLNVIGNLPTLKTLTLHKAGLTGIAPLENAAGLTYLDVSENTIVSISAISKLSQLTELYMNGNAVSDLTPLSTAVNLVKLDVSSNTVSSLAPLSNLSSLTELKANTNAITDLGEINKLAKLTKLELGSNQLASVGSIAGCAELVELNISSNSLTDISGLSKLSKLMLLDFSHNQVTDIPKFNAECALVTINGSYNQITSVKPLSGLHNLNSVNMSYNEKLSSIDPLLDCHVLIFVDVYGTKVSDDTEFKKRSINVSFNPLND